MHVLLLCYTGVTEFSFVFVTETHAGCGIVRCGIVRCGIVRCGCQCLSTRPLKAGTTKTCLKQTKTYKTYIKPKTDLAAKNNSH